MGFSGSAGFTRPGSDLFLGEPQTELDCTIVDDIPPFGWPPAVTGASGRQIAPTLIAPRRAPAQRFLDLQTEIAPARAAAAHDATRIGAYRIVRQIGAGAMGIVYEARHERLGSPVAIKVLQQNLLQHPELVQRFMGEAAAAARIRHPGMCDVYDHGHLPDGNVYLVMEYLEGQTLSERLDEGPLSLRDAVEIARQVAAVLVCAHGAGIVHRDLKPENIFLVRDREGAVRVKVLDFGIAKFMRNRVEAPVRTALGSIVGTPRYMAPEQCRSSDQVDHRCDIYALGCVLYHLVCGRLPFAGRVVDLLDAHLNQRPTSPRSINAQIPSALENLIVAMLAKHPEDRPQSMAEVEHALRKLELGTTLPPQPAAPGRRSWPLLALAWISLAVASGLVTAALS